MKRGGGGGEGRKRERDFNEIFICENMIVDICILLLSLKWTLSLPINAVTDPNFQVITITGVPLQKIRGVLVIRIVIIFSEVRSGDEVGCGIKKVIISNEMRRGYGTDGRLS